MSTKNVWDHFLKGNIIYILKKPEKAFFRENFAYAQDDKHDR